MNDIAKEDAADQHAEAYGHHQILVQLQEAAVQPGNRGDELSRRILGGRAQRRKRKGEGINHRDADNARRQHKGWTQQQGDQEHRDGKIKCGMRELVFQRLGHDEVIEGRAFAEPKVQRLDLVGVSQDNKREYLQAVGDDGQ